MSGKNLGFGSKLNQIKPEATEEEKPIPNHKIDEIGDRHGFPSRETAQKVVRRKEAEPSANLNIRPPISTYNRFVTWAMENRYSYPEALRELMDRAGVP